MEGFNFNKENIKPSQEEESKIISEEEFLMIHNFHADSPELSKWMEEKGIEFGDKVNIKNNDGSLDEMITSKEDFGTMKLKEGVKDIESGY